jgi:uncharacterized protein DUF87
MDPTPSANQSQVAPETSDSRNQAKRLNHLTIQDRAWIFVIYGGVAYLVSGLVTNDWLPAGPQNGLWFLSVIGMLAFRLLSSPFFPHPKESFVAAGTGVFVLWAVDLSASTAALRGVLEGLRLAGLMFLATLTAFTFLAMALGRSDVRKQRRRALVARFGYSFGVEFGKGEIVFTPPAVLGVFGFQSSLSSALVLSVVWIILGVAHPLERGLRTLRRTREDLADAANMDSIGTIERVDDPGLIRVTLEQPDKWKGENILAARLSDGRCVNVIPLFVQVRNAMTAGTGLFVQTDDIDGLQTGTVSRLRNPTPRQDVLAKLVGDGSADLVGFIVEGSTIDSIRFEVAGDHALREGYVVNCKVGSEVISYQITGAITTEESFERNPRGTVLVTAAQLGIQTENAGFRRFHWSPVMNAPVFRHKDVVVGAAPPGLTFGVVPGTNTWIRAEFDSLLRFHTAVLGTTGVGKTELVFDFIRAGLERDTKVACVDFTQEYAPRLADCNPQRLGFTNEVSEQLAARMEAVETGAYGGVAEKAALNQFITEIRPGIAQQVDAFLNSEGASLGLFELEDIANTRSTLRATELYLTEILLWARRHRMARKILIVLEEAHTIIPEANLFGYDKNETLAVIGRISQIALQGRKYGVGLVVVSQRTALVSKTILSQCGTVIAFSLVDRTSLEYLHSIFDEEHCKAIPSLPKRTAVVYGPGVHNERPVIVDIPFDQAKATAAAALAVNPPPAAPIGNAEGAVPPGQPLPPA